jgi:enoyl-CoA hydratase/carnithine racemase
MNASPQPAAQYETIDLRVDGPIATLELARPDSLNALSGLMLTEIEAAAVAMDDLPEVKVVVVRGQGRAFCAGADVSGFRGEVTRRERDQGWRTARALEQMSAVTVARIHGWCVGGGVVLASACDLRVASSDARFRIPEVDLGIPLAWGGIPRLVRELGPALTKELVMTCRPFDADEARSAGFVNRVSEPGALDAAVDELVATLVDKPTFALLSTKAHTNAVSEAMVHTGRSWGDAESLWAGFVDREGAEARRRYLEQLSKRSST